MIYTYIDKRRLDKRRVWVERHSSLNRRLDKTCVKIRERGRKKERARAQRGRGRCGWRGGVTSVKERARECVCVFRRERQYERESERETEREMNFIEYTHSVSLIHAHTLIHTHVHIYFLTCTQTHAHTCTMWPRLHIWFYKWQKNSKTQMGQVKRA